MAHLALFPVKVYLLWWQLELVCRVNIAAVFCIPELADPLPLYGVAQASIDIILDYDSLSMTLLLKIIDDGRITSNYAKCAKVYEFLFNLGAGQILTMKGIVDTKDGNGDDTENAAVHVVVH